MPSQSSQKHAQNNAIRSTFVFQQNLPPESQYFMRQPHDDKSSSDETAGCLEILTECLNVIARIECDYIVVQNCEAVLLYELRPRFNLERETIRT